MITGLVLWIVASILVGLFLGPIIGKKDKVHANVMVGPYSNDC